MERRVRPGIAFEDDLDESRHSSLLTQGSQLPVRVDPSLPQPTYRPLAGAQQNNRGQARNVTLTSGGAVQQVPSIVEAPKNSGVDAESLTVQLGLELPLQMKDVTSPYSNADVDIVCVLSWGVGGVSYSAELDWNQGVAFAVTANWLRVSARVAPPGAFGAPPIDIVLNASLGYGNSWSLSMSSPVRRTLLAVTAGVESDSLIAGASSALLPIPLWAVGFTLVDGGVAGVAPPVSPVVPDYTIALFNNAIGTDVSAAYKLETRTNLGLQVEGQFPVPARARFIQVTNNLGVDTLLPKLIFNLGF